MKRLLIVLLLICAARPAPVVAGGYYGSSYSSGWYWVPTAGGQYLRVSATSGQVVDDGWVYERSYYCGRARYRKVARVNVQQQSCPETKVVVVQPNAQQGNTVLGYGQQSPTNAQQLLQFTIEGEKHDALIADRNARSIEALVDGLKEAMANQQQALVYRAETRSQVAKQIAVGEAVARAFEAAAKVPAITETTTTTTYGLVQGGQVKPGTATALGQVLANRCFECHSPQSKIEGNVDLTKYASFTAEQKAAVFSAVVREKDPMPKNKPRLPAHEIALLAADVVCASKE